MVTVRVYFYLLLYFFYLEVGFSDDDDLYNKFHQKDYKVDIERAFVRDFNKSYGNGYYSTFKYNRTHFVTNVSFLLTTDLDYDLEVIVQVYKFLSNEYRTFPLHFEYNFCKGFKQDFAGIKSCAEKCGNLNCPLKKDIKYFICNCISDMSKLPPFMPNGRFKGAFEGRYKNEYIGTIENYVNVYRPILPGKRVG